MLEGQQMTEYLSSYTVLLWNQRYKDLSTLIIEVQEDGKVRKAELGRLSFVIITLAPNSYWRTYW
jgi:hypothetical protein